MKLPCWLVVTFLTVSLLAVLALAGRWMYWWITLPDRTVNSFIALMRSGDPQKANERLVNRQPPPSVGNLSTEFVVEGRRVRCELVDTTIGPVLPAVEKIDTHALIHVNTLPLLRQ
jgi:hypothetical protein